MKKTIFLALFAIVAILPARLVLGLGGPSFASEPHSIGVVQPSDAFPIDQSDRLPMERFYLSVPELRSVPNGRRIELPVIVFGAPSADDRAPVVMLSGGPGTDGVLAARYPGAYPWVGERDFVVFGQRGTHYAKPALMCPQFPQALRQGDPLSIQVEAVKSCRDGLRQAGVNLAAYNSAESARDIEDLRRALGADKLILYGLSYGSRLALAYARQFPENVEALVLDSPLPFAADFDNELAGNVENVLQAIANRCAKQSECASQFPELWPDFAQAIEQLEQTSEPGAEPIASQVALTIAPGSAADIAKAPALMAAAASGDLTPFVSEPTPIQPSNFAWGMRLSVWCSETGSLASSPAQAPFAGIYAPTFDQRLCDAWDVPGRPEGEVKDPSGDYPLLILAGEYDVITPPQWGARLLSGHTNARLITVPAGLHGVTTNWGGTGCAMSIAGAFIAAPEDFLERFVPAECLTAEPYPDFSLDR
ncbi:MAG: alpha/beta fold hydrolase [Pseudomonadota bacterium]